METLDITEQALQNARLQGQMDAYTAAMKECNKSAPRDGGSVGARTCFEIHNCIWDLYLAASRASLAI